MGQIFPLMRGQQMSHFDAYIFPYTAFPAWLQCETSFCIFSFILQIHYLHRWCVVDIPLQSYWCLHSLPPNPESHTHCMFCFSCYNLDWTHPVMRTLQCIRAGNTSMQSFGNVLDGTGVCVCVCRKCAHLEGAGARWGEELQWPCILFRSFLFYFFFFLIDKTILTK